MSEKVFFDKLRQTVNKFNLKLTMPKLLKVIDDLKLSPTEKKDLIDYLFSEDAKTLGKLDKQTVNTVSSRAKTLVFNFFGMNSNWPLGRNLLGGLMVHCPEYPTYFIPAFTQAKATGEATELKKGEGPRGIITGGLEGIAVGALVSGEMLRPREMGPYIILGAALQLFSSKVFPWLGEKMGRQIYLRRQAELKLSQSKVQVNAIEPESIQKISKPDKDKTTFSGYLSARTKLLGNLKI